MDIKVRLPQGAFNYTDPLPARGKPKQSPSSLGKTPAPSWCAGVLSEDQRAVKPRLPVLGVRSQSKSANGNAIEKTTGVTPISDRAGVVRKLDANRSDATKKSIDARGSGAAETARTIARHLFVNPVKMVKLKMNERQDKRNILNGRGASVTSDEGIPS